MLTVMNQGIQCLPNISKMYLFSGFQHTDDIYLLLISFAKNMGPYQAPDLDPIRIPRRFILAIRTCNFSNCSWRRFSSADDLCK